MVNWVVQRLSLRVGYGFEFVHIAEAHDSHYGIHLLIDYEVVFW